jgi:NAD+-dependent protein deacetylase sirtuin 4
MKRFTTETHKILKRFKNYKTPYYQEKEQKFEIFEPNLVPTPSKNFSELEFEHLKEFISKNKPITILSGAGLSTESGIPDYRSPNGSYSKGHRPIQFQEYRSSEKNRKRYWARNMIGYRLFNTVKPNKGHLAIATLQESGIVHNIITQNVDELHQKGGSNKVINLHGSNHEVICLQCRDITSRSDFQKRLEELNSQFLLDHEVYEKRSDGDAQLSESTRYEDIKIPNCSKCSDGMMKPNVVFFGESVPSETVERIKEIILKETGALIAVGSSLQVFSSFRFIKFAHENKIPIAIINIGETRGDDFCNLKIEAKCGDILNDLLNHF